MKSTSIHIERLEITASGLSPEAAREALASLGPDLARALEARIQSFTTTHAAIPANNAGTLRLSSSDDVAAFRRQIAERVASTALPGTSA